VYLEAPPDVKTSRLKLSAMLKSLGYVGNIGTAPNPLLASFSCKYLLIKIGG
jgi:hypothetical protein